MRVSGVGDLPMAMSLRDQPGTRTPAMPGVQSRFSRAIQEAPFLETTYVAGTTGKYWRLWDGVHEKYVALADALADRFGVSKAGVPDAARTCGCSGKH